MSSETRTPLVRTAKNEVVAEFDEEGRTLFGVFIEPDDKTFLALKELVDVLAIENDSRSFIPHVTLWEGLLPSDFNQDLLKDEVSDALVELCDCYPNDKLTFSIKCVDLHGEDSLRVEFSEPPALRFLERLLKFNIENHARLTEDYAPHLSLVHQMHKSGSIAHFADLKGKTEMAKTLEEIDSFEAKSLWIARVRPGEKTRTWEILSRFKL